MTTDQISQLLDELDSPNFFYFVDDKKIDKKDSNELFNQLENHEEAQRLFKIFTNCRDNVLSLKSEAEILLERGRFARSLFLTIVALEELGKSQIVADYISGLITKSDFTRHFKDHRVKTSFLARAMLVDKVGRKRLSFNRNLGKKIEKLRQAILYADDKLPEKIISEDNATKSLKVLSHNLDSIFHAEMLNERIGSKALFK